MTRLAPILQAFSTTRLTSQSGASPHTIAAYRDTWRLLLRYVEQTTGTAPAALDLCQLNNNLISGFLTHLETVINAETPSPPATPASRRCILWWSCRGCGRDADSPRRVGGAVAGGSLGPRPSAAEHGSS